MWLQLVDEEAVAMLHCRALAQGWSRGTRPDAAGWSSELRMMMRCSSHMHEADIDGATAEARQYESALTLVHWSAAWVGCCQSQ